MGKKAIKKVAKKVIMRKALSCFVVFVILMSAVPYAVVPNFLTIKGGR